MPSPRKAVSTARAGAAPSVDFTHDELVAFMQKAIAEQRQPALGDDPGLTTLEWAEVWKCPERNARGRLRTLWLAGHLINGWRRIPSMDGRSARAPVYRAK